MRAARWNAEKSFNRVDSGIVGQPGGQTWTAARRTGKDTYVGSRLSGTWDWNFDKIGRSCSIKTMELEEVGSRNFWLTRIHYKMAMELQG